MVSRSGSEGKIAESGTHDGLLAKRGMYWEMWNSQVGNGAYPIAKGSSSKEPPDVDRKEGDNSVNSLISYG